MVSIWYPLILVEVCLLLGWVLGYFLWSARKEVRRLRLKVITSQQSRENAPTIPSATAAFLPGLDTTDVPATDEVDGPTAAAAPLSASPSSEKTASASRATQPAQGAMIIPAPAKAPPETLEEARAANIRLTQELATQQHLLKETRDREKAKDREHQQLKSELATATRELARRDTALRELQSAHTDLSEEYQRLFEIFQK